MIRSYGEVDHVRTQMMSQRSRYIPTWRTQAEFISPHYFREFADRNNGNRGDSKILATTARRALRTFVSGMQNGATPQAQDWFKLATSNPATSGTQAAKKYFTELEQIFNSHFQISNTYQALPMMYKSMGVFSNSAMAMLPHARFGFYFYPFIVGSYGVGRSSEGDVNTFYRDFTMSVRQTVEMYGKLKPNGHIDWSSMDSYVKTLWDGKRYQENVMLTNVILPNDKPVQHSFQPEEKKFQSYTYIMAAGGGSNIPPQYNRGFRTMNQDDTGATLHAGQRNHFISVKGYDYFPVIASGWEIPPEDDYGVDGPGEIAIGDIQELQEMKLARSQAVDKIIRPPMVGPSSLRRHQSSILAGGITYVDENSETAKFRRAFEVDPKVAELVNMQEESIMAIKEAYYEDIFLKLAGDRLTSHVTARAVEEVASEKLTAIGPMLGQLDRDQNSKMIDNAQIILGAQNKLPQAPEELQGENLRPEYISPLAKAAKSQSAQSAEQFLNFAATVAEAFQDPSVLKMINLESMIRKHADFKGVDPNDILGEREFAKVKQAIAQQQQAEQQAAQQQQASETARNLSQAQTQPAEGQGRNLLQEIGERS